MPTFRKTAEVDEMLTKVMQKYHSELRDAGLTTQVLYAYPNRDENGDATAPAIKVNGYAALATVQIMSHKRRAAGAADVEIVLDWDNWSVSSDREQEALLDHELTHVELKTDNEGTVQRDDDDRPLLRIRKHDRQFGWFDAVARRFGEASAEVRQCREMLDSQDFKQCYLFDLEEASK